MGKHKTVDVVVGLTEVPLSWDSQALAERLKGAFKDRKAVQGTRFVAVEEPQTKQDGRWEVVVAFPVGYASESLLTVARHLASVTGGIPVGVKEE